MQKTTFISDLKGKFVGVIILMEAFFSISKYPPIHSSSLRCHGWTTNSVCEVCELDLHEVADAKYIKHVSRLLLLSLCLSELLKGHVLINPHTTVVDQIVPSRRTLFTPIGRRCCIEWAGDRATGTKTLLRPAKESIPEDVPSNDSNPHSSEK